MARVVASPPPKNWIRHQVERRVRPTRSSTTSRTTSSVRSVYDTALHIDDEACEPSERRKWRRVSKARNGPAQWHQSRVFFAALLMVLALCLSWTCWLLLLTMAPNEAINFIMRTNDLDRGSFWLFVEPTPSLRALTVAGLAIIALGYVYIGALLISWGRLMNLSEQRSGPVVDQLPPAVHDRDCSLQLQRGSVRRSTYSIASIHPIPSSLDKDDFQQIAARGPLRLVRRLYYALLYKDCEARKILHVWVKVIDLTLQQFMLYQILEAGFPIPLVVSCTLIVVWNAFAVVCLMYSPSQPSQVCEALVDATSDLLVAIIFPVLVLTYCMTTFEFDRQSQHLAASLLPRWSFQNAARVHANPEQMAKVFKSLEGLRFQSVSVCIARIGNNIALLISFWRLAKLLRGQVFPEFVGDTGANPKRSIYPRKHPLALLLVALAVATIAFVTISVYRSNKACELYPMCTMHAYRWGLSSKTSDTGNAENLDNGWNCPCRVLVDADLTPTTFSAWKNPPDATAHVSTLAASGDLEILQLINRRLPELPDTLRRCTHLKHIALIFTHTLTLPLWAAEFTELEFLHIEGKSRVLSLVSLPQELFAKMNKLTFVHHLNLARLPDVAGLTNLRSITLARLEAVTTLPSDFARLRHLETMLVLMMPNLKAFPDLSRSRQALKTLVIDLCPLCCDGFLQSVCDLHSASCGFQNSQETASLTCLPAGLSATAAMLNLFNTFNSTICVQPPKPPSPQPQSNMDTGSKGGDSSFPLNSEFDVALEQRMLQCGGILYRECKLGSELSAGICSSDHYMPISCIDDPSIIEFRRQQIKRHFGPPCDSKYEGWLGCISS